MDQVPDVDATLVDGLIEVDEDGASEHGDDDLRELSEALEGADELPIDARLALLRRAEEAISGSLEGLDGL